MIQLPIYEEFAHWLDDHIYGVQLVATCEFDPDDKDGEWACEEVWSCEENIFTVDTSDEDDTGREHAQELIKEMAEEYLGNGRYKDILNEVKGTAIGVVDGDLESVK